MDSNKTITLGSIWNFQKNMGYRSSKANVDRLDTFLEEKRQKQLDKLEE